LARVTLRAANDVGDRIYDTGVSVGRELFRRVFNVAQTGDEAALEAVTAEYAAHLEAHPDERKRVLPAILEVAVPQEPLAVLEAIVVVMWETAKEVALDPPVAGMAGCVAFAGSLVDPNSVTVMDVRGRDQGQVCPAPSLNPEDKERGLKFDHEFRGFDYTYTSAPRMWIVKTSEAEYRDALVEELNELFIGKRTNPYPSQLKDAMARVVIGGTGGTKRGKLRQVQEVLADRVNIYYPDHQKDREMAAEPDLVKRVSMQMQRTDIDDLRDRELVEFDIDGPAGVLALLTSIEQVRGETKARARAHNKNWAEAGLKIGELGDEEPPNQE
jgi:hypothetical protein